MEENPAKSAKIDAINLPDHIVMEEILPRLPVKSLLRFKSVSKNWLHFISKNPKFAKLYLKLSSLLRRQFFIINSSPTGKCSEFHLLPYPNCDSENKKVGLGDGKECDENHIVDSCNGLVCLYYRVDDQYGYCTGECLWKGGCYFTLWNPLTRQLRDIKSPLGVDIARSYGYGYVPSLDDYKIVASFATGWHCVRKFRGLYVFSLRTGKWERLVVSDSEYSSRRGGKWRRVKMICSGEEVGKANIAKKLKGVGLLIDDTMYWPPSEWNSNENIVGFDLVSEAFKEYNCLDWQIEYKEVNFFRWKGCLALNGYNEAFNVREFWVLKNVDDWYNSWQKLFSVDQTKVSPIIAISESGKCLVRESELKVVDLSQEDLEYTRLKSQRRLGLLGPSAEKAVDHVDSLVSPFGTLESTEEKENIEAIENSTTDGEDFEDDEFSAEFKSDYDLSPRFSFSDEGDFAVWECDSVEWESDPSEWGWN